MIEISTADGSFVSSIERGLCLLVGISRDDTRKDVEYMARKILNMRLFEDDADETRRLDKSVKERNLEVLCLSNITLYQTLKGNKLDFRKAMAPAQGRALYDEFISELKTQYGPEKIKMGIYGERLVIGIRNDGPVTVVLESPKVNTPSDRNEQTVPDLDETSNT